MIPRIPQGWSRGRLNKNLDCSMLLLQAELDSLETQKRQFILAIFARPIMTLSNIPKNMGP